MGIYICCFFQCGLPGSLHVPRRKTTMEQIYGAPGVMEAESEKVQSNNENQNYRH